VEIDTDKIDDAVLGLLWLTLHEQRRAWKGFGWEALDRVHQKGLIADPANKAKSVVLSDEGLRRAEEAFRALFTRPTP
jgi:DNA-binding transcriptional regulator PaaX